MTLEQARVALARLCRRKDLRIAQFTRLRPCEWRPTEVINPESDLPFTEVRAWEFIAEQLDQGHHLEQIVLEQPPGEIGYVILINLGPAVPCLYIKLQFVGGRVLGRSFHYSDR